MPDKCSTPQTDKLRLERVELIGSEIEYEGDISENLKSEWNADPSAPELLQIVSAAEQNVDAAIPRFKKLAENGSALSAAYLGDLYLYGRYGLKQNLIEAEFWLNQGAEGGSIEGAYKLAICLGLQKKFEPTYALHRRLAANGYSPSMFSLGCAYLKEEKLGVDYAQALKHFEEGVRAGHIHSMLWVSYLLRRGFFGWKSIPLGYLKWFPATISAFRQTFRNPQSDRLRP